MTYGVERMTARGNTLHDKLRAQFGERAAQSVSRGLEANAKKREAAKRAEKEARAPKAAAPHPAQKRERTAAPRNISGNSKAADIRSVTSAMRAVGANSVERRTAAARTDSVERRTAAERMANSVERKDAPRRPATAPVRSETAQSRPNTANVRQRADHRGASREAARVYSEPIPSRLAAAREIYALRNPYRARVNYMRRPVTGKSDLEISIATFPRAYHAGMRAKRVMGDKIVDDASSRYAKVNRGYRPGDVRSEQSALENSVGVMPNAYRRGEHMRQVTNIEKARPTPKNAVGLKKPSAVDKLIAAASSLINGKGRHSAELRVRRSPFPVGTIVLIIVFTLTLMATISSFAQLSEYRADISVLENTQTKLELDRSRLTGLVESREDVRVIEKIATQDIGMVSAELAKGRFVSLADSDRVEVIEDAPEKEDGVFATILSAIAVNLGELSDYIN